MYSSMDDLKVEETSPIPLRRSTPHSLCFRHEEEFHVHCASLASTVSYTTRPALSGVV